MSIEFRNLPRGEVTEREMGLIAQSIVTAFNATESKTFVEVGVFRGETSRGIFAILQGMPGSSMLYGVDYNPCTNWFDETSVVDTQCKIKLIRDYSHRASSLVKRASWVFIDGCHCCECVKVDIEHWAGKVEMGGFLLFHDTDPQQLKVHIAQPLHDDGRAWAVLRAIEESRSCMQNFVLVAEISGELRNSMGGLQVYIRSAI